MNIVTLPVIIVICYITGEIIKIVFNNKTKIKKLIPFILGILGGIIGVLIYITNKEVIQTTSIWESILVGTISGLSSTGTNQLIKKIKELKGE